ncbi:acetylglutamate kinase [Poseidonibacter ostreae]|jgi:acetylglutamate kinase|uniref:Acetylglutamate kinase n=1 Tax=Poseidonibacter ostreae TaxID=2654171 RepID=A0A6L4WWC0_9BACT|nr:acetylglutamate kinase [Poseidonibacter ostreae]KAB7887962.1 acetylglutamate kinase [Poseidonibacter ostreae]KAB7891119.1 acetylglutamate kinase [Poseidonibacter ostreae]KAB7892843.1 acetylglutamate kinase [Poseidonibacter ostreae]MAC84679.1 acetylglutamate kinase [Arcobacter sp.]|tara:strand:- start:2181 stop:3092 length:912 start_codon:yes stop_codon:yes gene_type:complete
MQKKHQKVQILLDAIPYIKKFNGKTIVIKYGGSAQTSPELQEKFAEDIVLLSLVGIKPVIVHGGGARISELLEKLEIKSEFIDGHRVTSKDTMRVVEMVLSGEINKNLTSLLNHHGAKAIGISGKDSAIIKAQPKDGGKFGYTGEITEVNGELINNLLNQGFIPVIAPIADSAEPNHPGFNINADFAASKVAAAVKAQKVLFLTDIVGVLNKEGKLLTSLDKKDVDSYIEDGTIAGGMIPKVDSCIQAIHNGVNKAHIIDGRVEHSILLELFTSDGIGTQFLRRDNPNNGIDIDKLLNEETKA